MTDTLEAARAFVAAGDALNPIDPRLADLIREAAAKLDALESPQHVQEVALLRDLDNRRVAVAEAVQTRIIEATSAQQAVLNYRAGMDDLPELNDMVHSYAEEPETFRAFEPNTAYEPLAAT